MNTSKTKLFTLILSKEVGISELDYIEYFYGAKIIGKWYFWQGERMVIPRETYGYSEDEPIPFDKLHQIAIEEVYQGYLKLNAKTRKYEINDKFFDRMSNKNSPQFGGFGSCFTFKTEEEYFKFLVKENWRKKTPSQ